MSFAKIERVWVVSSGSYSDYRVLCACPSEAEAKALSKKVGLSDVGYYSGETRVESLAFVSAAIIPLEVLRLSTTLWDDGRETETRERVTHEWPFEDDCQSVEWRWVRAPCHHESGGRLDVHGYDHKRVRKVYSDRRAELIAVDAVRLKKLAEGRGRR